MATTTQKNKGKHESTTPPAATEADIAAATTALATQSANTQIMEHEDYGDDAGLGFQNQTAADRKIPMLAVLQAGSPQVAESRGKILAGQIINTVTGQIYDEVHIVPAITDHCYIEWVPKDDGGGFRGRHAITAPIVREAIAKNGGRSIGKLKAPDVEVKVKDGKTKLEPRELVESFEIYAITFTGDQPDAEDYAVISFTSAKIKNYREWNTEISKFQLVTKDKVTGEPRKRVVPIFAHRVKLSTELMPAKNGNPAFFVFKIEPLIKDPNAKINADHLRASLLSPKDPRYQGAKLLQEQQVAGIAKAGYETQAQEDHPKGGAGGEAEVPF